MTYINVKFTAEDVKRARQPRPLWDVFADEDDQAYQQRKADMEYGDWEQTEPDYA